MERKDILLQYCRYYKGGGVIKETDPDKQTYEKIEMVWVDRFEQSNDLFSNEIVDYVMAGLIDFEKFDDTPITLKALLFNRFTKYNERIDIPAFKKWYQQYTKKGEE